MFKNINAGETVRFQHKKKNFMLPTSEVCQWLTSIKYLEYLLQKLSGDS